MKVNGRVQLLSKMQDSAKYYDYAQILATKRPKTSYQNSSNKNYPYDHSHTQHTCKNQEFLQWGEYSTPKSQYKTGLDTRLKPKTDKMRILSAQNEQKALDLTLPTHNYNKTGTKVIEKKKQWVCPQDFKRYIHHPLNMQHSSVIASDPYHGGFQETGNPQHCKENQKQRGFRRQIKQIDAIYVPSIRKYESQLKLKQWQKIPPPNDQRPPKLYLNSTIHYNILDPDDHQKVANSSTKPPPKKLMKRPVSCNRSATEVIDHYFAHCT